MRRFGKRGSEFAETTGEAKPVRSRRHRSDLQGLRAVAVLLVAADHAGIGVLKGGFVGVDVFFVLSGFLITGLLLSGAARHGYVSLADFYARRARRILPAAMLTLATVEVFSYYFLNFVRAKQIMLDGTWATVFAANVYFAHQGTNYFAQNQPPSPIQHFWSLAVEEQFYLVWPALLSIVLLGSLTFRLRGERRRIRSAAVRRLFIAVVVIAGASLAWSIHYTHSNPAASYFSTFTRLWELALGAALAILASGLLPAPRLSVTLSRLAFLRPGIGWLGLAAIAVAAVGYSSATPFPGDAALLPTLGAALVIAAGIGPVSSRLAVGRLLSVRPMQYIGDRSYAFYLWHWPALILASLYAGRNLSVGVNVLLLGVAFAVSVVSYRFVENPIHRSQLSLRGTGVMAAAVLAGVFLVGSVAIYSLNAKATSVAVASDRAALALATQSNSKAARASAKRAVAAALGGRTLPGVVAAVRAADANQHIPLALNPPVSALLTSWYNFPPGCGANDGQTTNKICRLGDAASPRLIVVFGDSHAEMWMPAILSMAAEDHWAVIPFSKSACTPQKWLDGKDWGECHTWYEWAVRQVRALHPRVVIESGCCGGFGQDLATTVKNSFFSLASSVKPSAKSVMIVGDNVEIAQQPVDCLLAAHATMRSCTTTWPPDRFYLNDDLATLSRLHHIGFIDTSGWYCFENQCPMVVDHTIVYIDTGHITDQYALLLAQPFRASFRQQLTRLGA